MTLLEKSRRNVAARFNCTDSKTDTSAKNHDISVSFDQIHFDFTSQIKRVL